VLHLREPAAEIHDADPPLRVGFVVSRAVGPAVVRNLVKRRLRHLLRERLASLPGSGTLVVRALPAAGGASYPVLGAELDRLLDRLPERLPDRLPERLPDRLPDPGHVGADR